MYEEDSPLIERTQKKRRERTLPTEYKNVRQKKERKKERKKEGENYCSKRVVRGVESGRIRIGKMRWVKKRKWNEYQTKKGYFILR